MARGCVCHKYSIARYTWSLKWDEYQNGKFIFYTRKIFPPIEFAHIFLFYELISEQ